MTKRSSARWIRMVRIHAPYERAATQASRELVTCARKLANFREAKQIGHDGFAAPVLVGAVGMQAVAAASRFQIDQRQGQIIAAQKPGECARGIGLPSASPSARQAARQAEIVAVASSGC